MVVSKGVDRDGVLELHDFSGVHALADALKVNSALLSIKCASNESLSEPFTLLGAKCRHSFPL
eukprot:2277502-Prymnesium_polylepis.2